MCTHPLLYPHHRDVSFLLSPTAISRRALCSTVVCSLAEDKPVITTYGVKSLYLLSAPSLTKLYYRSSAGRCKFDLKLLTKWHINMKGGSCSPTSANGLEIRWCLFPGRGGKRMRLSQSQRNSGAFVLKDFIVLRTSTSAISYSSKKYVTALKHCSSSSTLTCVEHYLSRSANVAVLKTGLLCYIQSEPMWHPDWNHLMMSTSRRPSPLQSGDHRISGRKRFFKDCLMRKNTK